MSLRPCLRIRRIEVIPVVVLLPPGAQLPRTTRDARNNRTFWITPKSSLYEIVAFIFQLIDLVDEYGGHVSQYFRRGSKIGWRDEVVELDPEFASHYTEAEFEVGKCVPFDLGDGHF